MGWWRAGEPLRGCIQRRPDPLLQLRIFFIGQHFILIYLVTTSIHLPDITRLLQRRVIALDRAERDAQSTADTAIGKDGLAAGSQVGF
ncbi:hypothetical protein MKQ70_37040 [Chitinophaga sedimenti]|uniref:hypothetical protein n=1 Tax=Chitinophaga sedimenti TaxID=2033606 RepID=UPI002004FDF4|nr:hypothetical protein [Chitinophaga sedimenti]MCK7560218.1 hypothetical protein [Chitinophaga sedimenti]